MKLNRQGEGGGSSSASAIITKEESLKVIDHLKGGQPANQIDSSDYEEDDDGQYEEVGFEDYDDSDDQAEM